MQLAPIRTVTSLSTEDILLLLPHRYPMLFIDRLEKVVPMESAVGIKNITANESFFSGHFPGNPVMPGVFIIEAMAQTAAALVMHTLDITHHDHNVYFMSVTEARFRKPAYPGDTLELAVQKKHHRGMVWKFEGKAFVKSKLIAEALYTAMISTKK